MTPFVSLTAMSNGLRVERICKNCDRTFITLARHVRRGNRGIFCCLSCHSAWEMKRRHRGDQSGPNNPNWKGGLAKNHMRYRRRFLEKSPEKVAAQNVYRNAVARGELVRPESCSQCGVVCKAHGHHDDYTKPLEVRWLCRLCHNRFHAAQRSAATKRAERLAGATMRDHVAVLQQSLLLTSGSQS